MMMAPFSRKYALCLIYFLSLSHYHRVNAFQGPTTVFSSRIRRTRDPQAPNSLLLSATKGFGRSSSTNEAPKKSRSMANKGAAGTKVLRKAINTYEDLVVAQNKDPSSVSRSDVYIRSPQNSATIFWFVGKVAHRQDTNAWMACVAQKRLILEYAVQKLRPQNFGGMYQSSLELWTAPGDSEMDVVQNKVNLTSTVEYSLNDLDVDFRLDAVGYSPEIYVGDEIHQGGLRVERNVDGTTMHPVFEVNESM